MHCFNAEVGGVACNGMQGGILWLRDVNLDKDCRLGSHFEVVSRGTRASCGISNEAYCA